MKKIRRLLFTFLFLGFVGLNGVSAEGLKRIYNTEAYNYGMKDDTGKMTMSIVENQNIDAINKAVVDFYPESSGAVKVNVVPFEFSVKEGNTWNSATDKLTMYINIPKEFNLSKGNHIYILKVNAETGAFEEVFGADRAKNYSLINSSEVTINTTKKEKSDYLSDKFAMLETSNFATTGKTYYLLITCQGEEPTIPTTPTTTTTVDNPKTFDNNNSQVYLVLGAVCVIAIAGLGIKFAKTSK